MASNGNGVISQDEGVQASKQLGDRRHSHSTSAVSQHGKGGAVELALVPAVDLAPLIASATVPKEMQDGTQSPTEADKEKDGGIPGQVHMSTEYLQYLEALSRSWTDCPAVEVTFDNLSYSVRNAATIADAATQNAAQVRRAKGDEFDASAAPTAAEENIPNLAKAWLHLAQTPVRLAQSAFRAATGVKPNPAEVLQALAPCSGIIRPGSMTLILAPPGAGKSVLLRALSGRLSHDSGLQGTLLYNGLSRQEASKRGIHVTRLASYVGQADVQFPVLTVEETLEFARQNGVADVELLKPDAQLRAMDQRRTELLMDLLGLTECRSTAIGSDLMRGISGGQKKRAQLGETMMSNARLYALDEVSNGLDSAVTLHIFSALKQACAVNQGSVVTALQQVTPETYALFDSVILLREGHVVYHGPRTDIHAWLRDLMHVPSIPDSLEEAGFLVDLLSDPKQALEKAALAHKVALAQEQGRKPSPPPQAVDISAHHAGTVVVPERDNASPSPSPAAPSIVRFHLDETDVDPPKSVVPVTIASAVDVRPQQVSASSLGASPYKLSPAVLESLTDLDQLLAANKASAYTQSRLAAVSERVANKNALSEKTMNVSSWSPYTKSQYGQEFPHSTLRHTVLACGRQTKLLGRNLTMVVPRLFNSVLMGLVYGLLFYQLPQNDFASRLGIIQNAVMFMAFANFQELPVAAEGKQVVVRQIDAGFLPAISYTTAVNVLTLPLAMVEAIIFGIIVYFLPGFELDAGRFFFFLFLLLSVSSAMSQTFRTITYISGNADVAQQMNMPFVMLFVVYGGFLIPRSSIQDWLIWAYYLSPFSWATDALAVNEFSAGTYGEITASGRRLGDTYLDAFGLRAGKVWQWAAIAYLWGFYLFLSWVSALLLRYSTPTNPMGTKRAPALSKALVPSSATAGNNAADVQSQQVRIEINGAEVGSNGSAVAAASNGVASANGSVALAVPEKRLGGSGARSSAKASFQLTTMPFTPATLSWKDLKYTVYIGKAKTPRVLLNHISGFAEPGKLTALMGSSGAGKTTLLDVLAGRKTVGLIESESNIFINGRPKDPASFATLTGYVEQTDIHNGMATVKEALDFSAKLRLPTSVSDATRQAFVHEVMQLVGLSSVQNRMIGDVSQPSLSTGQLKLLTIAVELVANPSDEPTSGLDSKSAFRVMKAIKRIAATGRTIVCTIHQPSQEVFMMFDRLLLLRRGGETVYFDEIGQQGDRLVEYLTRASRNLIPYSQLVSPANWMLDVVGLDATQIIEEQKAEADAKEAEAKEREKSDPKSAKSETTTVNVAPVEATAAAAASSSTDAAPAIADASLKAAFKKKLMSAKSSAKSFREAEAAGEDVNVEPIQFSEVWKNSPEAADQQRIVDRYSEPSEASQASAPGAEKLQYVSSLTRLGWVVRRAYLSHWRSPPVNVTRCILMGIIGIFLGVVYYQLRVDSYAGMASLLAAVFLGVSLPSSICSNASLAMFFRQRAVYYRESSVNMYGYLIYTATMTIVELPYLLMGLLFFLLPFYFMVGLSTNAGLFFQFLLPGYLMCLFFSCMEQVWIAGLPNIIAAQALNGLMMSILFAFGGLYITASAIPIGWKWFYYIDPIPKSFIATMLTQVWCPDGGVEDPSARIDGCRQIDVPGEGPHELYDYVRQLLEGAHHQYWWMIGYLCLSIFVARAFSVYLFKKVSHIER